MRLDLYAIRMPRKGPAYPIDTEWRTRVQAAISAMKISHAEFARRAKVSKASLSEVLSEDSTQSTLVPAIHRALGWGLPRPILLSRDTEELVTAITGMDPRDISALKERALFLREQRKKNKD